MDFVVQVTANVTAVADNSTRSGAILDQARRNFVVMLPSDVSVSCLIVVFFSVYCLSLAVNGFALLALLQSEELYWQPRSILQINLAVSDILLTTTLVPSVLYCLINGHTVLLGFWCQVELFIGTICIFNTLSTLTLMAVERYLYICHAIHYLRVLTPRRVRLSLLIVWLLAVAMCSVYIILLNAGSVSPEGATMGLLCEPDVLEKQMGFPLAASAFRKAWGLASVMMSLTAYVLSYFKMYWEARNAVEPFNRTNGRARNTVIFYSAMFVLQVIPYWLRSVTDFLWELDLEAMREQTTTTGIHLLLLVLITLTPCINPIIYSLRNREVRRAIPLIAGRLRCPSTCWCHGGGVRQFICLKRVTPLMQRDRLGGTTCSRRDEFV